MTQTYAPLPLPARPEEEDALRLALSPGERTLLAEAQQLTGTADAQAVLVRALGELVERQRFLAWVKVHEADA